MSYNFDQTSQKKRGRDKVNDSKPPRLSKQINFGDLAKEWPEESENRDTNGMRITSKDLVNMDDTEQSPIKENMLAELMDDYGPEHDARQTHQQ